MSSSTQLISSDMNQTLQLLSSISEVRSVADAQVEAATQNAGAVFEDFIANMKKHLEDLERERAQLIIKNTQLEYRKQELAEAHKLLITALNEERTTNNNQVTFLQNESVKARLAQTAARTALAVANAAEVAALASETSVESREAVVARVFRENGLSFELYQARHGGNL